MNPYLPDHLPPPGIGWERLVRLIGPANAALARYDGLLQGVVNPDVLLSPLRTQEAVLSSRIEGTQATLDEVLEHEAGDLKTDATVQDIREILNYRSALALARDVLADQPISLALIRQMHRMLLDSVRGKNKTPGEFRREQNWIGRPGCSIEEASFVPPSPLVVAEHLDRWESYLRAGADDVLVQLALVHAQFELIHPFNDGNGRIGRLLIPLFLFQKGMLSSPSFYLSEYLEEHRDQYYARLQAISAAAGWDGWIAFFLEAVEVQARRNAERVKAMLELYERMKQRIVELTRSQYALAALDAIFDRPIFASSEFVQRSGIPKQTALPMLRTLRNAGLLDELRAASGRRPAILEFPALLEIVER